MNTSTVSALILGAFLSAAVAPAFGHGPDQAKHQIASLGDMTLEAGGVIKNLKMSYVTHGKLNAAKDNAILLLHGFAANHHNFDFLIGPGKPFDTNKYFIIASDAFGSTQTGFEHSTSPTSSGLKMRFPPYNGRDMVKAQYQLVTAGLGVRRLVAVSGISMGGDHALQFAVSYPDFVDGVIPISGTAIWNSSGFLAGMLLETAIESCAGWQDGNYRENPRACGAIGLWAQTPWFYTREWWDQHITTPESFEQWRQSIWDAYVGLQETRDLYYLSKAMGHGWVGDTPGFNDDLGAVLRSITARTLFVMSTHDQWLLPAQIQAQVEAMPSARVLPIDSSAGHLICCNADPQATAVMGPAIQAFLQELRPQKTAEQ